jgi:pyrophosphatase PpaX
LKIEAFIFDLDGTLGNTLPVCYAAFQHVFAEYLGQHYSDPEVAALFGPSEEGIFQNLVPDRWESCMQSYLEAYERVHGDYAGPFPGLEQALALLQERGVPMAIVTGKGASSAAISLKHLGIAHYFEMIEAGSAGGAVKPQAMAKVLAHWGVAAQHVACVGDAPSDVRAAKKVGAIPLGAAWAETTNLARLSAEEPLTIFQHVEDFIAWIERNVEKV